MRLIEFCESLEAGAAENYGSMEVVPLRRAEPGTGTGMGTGTGTGTGTGAACGEGYVSLTEALQRRTVTVTELGEDGSVPNLKVRNTGAVAVLMLDGEELSGAKQNRVLNTTILLGAESELVVPVSCTERGRWAYQSAEFESSGHIMASEIRRQKSRSVSRSLREDASYASDQGEVWESISELHASAGTTSETGAMRDAFEARLADLSGYEAAFGVAEGQQGFVVLIDGQPAGFEYVSEARVYRQLHGQLIRSYAMDALLARPGGAAQEKGGAGAGAGAGASVRAQEFIDALKRCECDGFASIGLGRDYRYDGGGLVGSALLEGSAVVHAAFFANRGEGKRGEAARGRRMASLSQRRRFRRGSRGDV